MGGHEERDVVAVARAVRPHLGRLVGGRAGAVDGQLGELLRRADEGRPVKADLLKVLDQYDAIRDWAQRLFEVAPGERVYQPFPGLVQSVVVPRYVCPRFPECHTEFYRFSAAEPVPSCAVHGVALAEAEA